MSAGTTRTVGIPWSESSPHPTGELLIAHVCPGEPDEAPEYEEALGYVDRAVAGFAEAGAGFVGLRTTAELMAAWLEADLGRPSGARGPASGATPPR
ncbi:hypothetical protein OG520_11230 [Streptomyces sp. NBC_00984]|uniref:hypothetical protein n=1 Tax=Streptomyces sp. NBC_00984 TaxID=2903700 RepID=UPI003868BAF5|nr:hypothetical protein OG520_11230 [Streptomyces sp. NBC_00984]